MLTRLSTTIFEFLCFSHFGGNNVALGPCEEVLLLVEKVQTFAIALQERNTKQAVKDNACVNTCLFFIVLKKWELP